MQCCNFSLYKLKCIFSRSFSEMKLVKTRLRNRLCDKTLDETMRLIIEGPETLMYEDLDTMTF